MKKLFCGFIVILFLATLSGCATTASRSASSELEDRMDSLETRIKSIEKGQKQLETMVSSQVPTQQITRTSTVQKAVIENPSNKDIQVALQNAGFYTGEIDGKIGPKTRDAIMEFQKKHGLKVDGVVGRNTWEILSEYY